jgi:hypothetical protein
VAGPGRTFYDYAELEFLFLDEGDAFGGRGAGFIPRWRCLVRMGGKGLLDKGRYLVNLYTLLSRQLIIRVVDYITVG